MKDRPKVSQVYLLVLSAVLFVVFIVESYLKVLPVITMRYDLGMEIGRFQWVLDSFRLFQFLGVFLYVLGLVVSIALPRWKFANLTLISVIVGQLLMITVLSVSAHEVAVQFYKDLGM